MASFFCSTKFFLLFFFLSAIPIAYIIHLETSTPPTHVFHYYSTGWLRECAKWDGPNRRFIVSFFEGGLGVIPVDLDYSPDNVLTEIPVVKDFDLTGNASLGLTIDRERNRVLVAVADVFGNRYSALAAYDLASWSRLFLTKLCGPEDEKAFADDVVVDTEGNAYVTDAKGSKIWKVDANGEFKYAIKNPIFTPKEWYNKLVGLNGIVYHPNGYLLVIHTFTGNLYKIEISKNDEVKLVKINGGSLKFGDGLELMSPTKLVVAGNPTKLVESSDDWESGSIAGNAKGASHRLVTAATVKEGRVYLSHMFGLGYPKTHVLVEAAFSA